MVPGDMVPSCLVAVLLTVPQQRFFPWWTQDSHNNRHVKYKELFKYYLLRLARLQPGPYQGREGRQISHSH